MKIHPITMACLLPLLLILCKPALSQPTQYNLEKNMRQHVAYLASDSLEGRATGSEGERLAYEYIIKAFESMELEPQGDNESYLQAFEFTAEKRYTKNNELSVNGTPLIIEEQYYPLAYSGNASAKGTLIDVGYGISAPDLGHDDYKGKKKLKGRIFLIATGNPDADNPHSDYAPYAGWDKKLELAKKHGAAGIIVVGDDPPPAANNLRRKAKRIDLPVVYVSKGLPAGEKRQISMKVEVEKVKKTGHNVLAYIDKGAENTIVLGAHYDHLGHGESGGSLHTGAPEIHNGADDNASGVAMIIELARWLTHADISGNNYLIAAFSGEELGLYGSAHFAQNFNIKTESVNYMLNFDMVGRLDSITHKVQINGTGTSPTWSVLTEIEVPQLGVSVTESGVGPSDHSSFYWQKIPAIHFFTGAHNDYHKPSDDYEKVNFDGMEVIYEYVQTLIDSLDDDGKLEFTTTKQEKKKAAPRFKVTMGVMPDYMFDEKGMRISGIIDDRPAAKAGLLAGDIVIKLGDVKVEDMMTYMEALSALKAGDETKVTISRNGEIMEFSIVF